MRAEGFSGKPITVQCACGAPSINTVMWVSDVNIAACTRQSSRQLSLFHATAIEQGCPGRRAVHSYGMPTLQMQQLR